MTQSNDLTKLLVAWGEGDDAALRELTPLVEDELRRLAARYMRNERSGHTLQTTALVNEAFIRLIDWKNVKWQNRAHFFGVSAQLMRRILVDYARSKQFEKRGGKAARVELDEALSVPERKDADLVALDDALTTLASIDERKARIVELRFFGGLSVEEVAEVLEVSSRTVMREWSFAQAWLFRELDRSDG